jgi:pimeloyl-ACP methyl ester carboxylesterase
MANAKWTESSTNNVTIDLMESILKTWLTTYTWRSQEAELNTLPQFTTTIPVAGFHDLTVHFVHSPSPKSSSVPLLFLHGWPGSVFEISKALPLLAKAGFHIIAPSLPGWLFSSSPPEKGFQIPHIAECFHKLMLKLGYGKYIVQGGDWGGEIAPTIAGMYPEHVVGMHMNYFPVVPEPVIEEEEEKNWSAFERESVHGFRHWQREETAYNNLQSTKPLTLGISLHDSPIGMLAWMTDKLFSWSDCYLKNTKGYKWTNEELITWTMLHWCSENGPTAPFQMYRENDFGRMEEGNARKYVECPTGVSAFRGEPELSPRKWAETRANVVWWREHPLGGHFAMYERPEEMVGDIVDFVEGNGIRGSV